jgi:2-polyprenyl-6-methoxyphenol hydroxylase-like FAD-dependent oxidoreductase
MKALPSTTDVLIVGAGPTGLTLAISMQQAGIAHVLIDKLAAGQNTSRAAVIHAHTLDMLDELGVSTLLADQGLRLSRFTILDRDRRLLEVPFDRLPTTHPYLLMLPQDATERILADRLVTLGGVIHRGATATRLDRRAGRIDVTVGTQTGDQVIGARFVVGADGAHSMVRDAIGAEFAGGPYEESFVLADVRMNWSHGRDQVQLFFSPAGLVVIAPLLGSVFRIVATLEDAPESPAASDIQALIDARGPTRGTAEIVSVLWSSRFRIHHRLTSSYRDEHLLLVGDAAHVHRPAGGQGMNTGLVDACVLGRLIARVIVWKQPESALEQYHQLRRPAAEQVLGLAGRLTSLATMKNPLKRRVRNTVLSLLNHLPPAKHRLAMNLSGLSRRRFAATVDELDAPGAI